MSDTMSDPPEDDRVLIEPFEEALSSRYLAYALSTITQRALPDVRDGLKPVQRRLLYAMRRLKLDPKSGFKKCARVVGDVIGQFHPHGEQAVYDAMVRLAQDFSQRYPLVEGQGNFGNVDGDNAAAMRYTEARLTPAAELLLAGLDEGTVDFRETYDGEDEEPIVLPAGYPNLLANGATGIAVGMATAIPPHNAGELIAAARALIQIPDMGTAELMTHVKGPDFPTGGVIVEPHAAMAEAYETGRGGFRTRARWTSEDLGRGVYQIVVTEIPYQVQKAKLIERLAELIETKKAPLLGDVRDESAEDIRIVLEPKTRNVDPAVLMESLFKLSELETRIPLNLNVLDRSGAPHVMSLKEALQAFLDHAREVLVRRSRTRLAAIEKRLEVLAGYLIVFLNLDEVIAIIREEDQPKPALMARFGLSDVQAEAILNMRLRALRKLEEMELKTEDQRLREERDGLQALLEDRKRQWREVDQGLKDAAKAFGPDTPMGPRRTGFADAPDTSLEAPVEAFVVKEPITVVLSKKGWIRALKGRVENPGEIKFKEGDGPAFVFPAETTDKLLFLADDGRAFTLGGDKLPRGRGFGEPIRLSIELGDEPAIIDAFVFEPGRKRVLAASSGHGFIVTDEDLVGTKRSGRQVMTLSAPVKLLRAEPISGDHIAVIGENRKLLLFPLSELPEMARGKGVKLQNYRDGGLMDFAVFAAEEGFGWTDAGGRARKVEDWRDWLGKRASAGRLAPRGFPRSGRFRPSQFD
ncbi:MAG: DNA topoisomerase IV subunit A [Maricaulaceae bacterium]